METQVKIRFQKGLPAFENIQEFFLESEEGSFFYRLKGVEHPEICFLLVDPFLFFPDYAFDMDEEYAELLELKDVADVSVLTVLTVEKPLTETTANLLAPIVINVKNLTGMQVILHHSGYTIKHPVFDAGPEKEG